MATKTNTKPAAKQAAKSTPKQSMSSQAKTFIEGSGEAGVTAVQIAQHLNLINDEMEKADRTAALKKVRVLARKAMGGPSQSRDGRSAVYTIA
jgi:hypothetical protein